MKNLHGIIFGYVGDAGLGELGETRTAPSIPFGSRYRIIDFILSAMTNAGITDIGVVLEERYQSLLDHLGSGKTWDLVRKRGGLKLLPPFGMGHTHSSAAYLGHIDALDNIRTYLARIREDYIVLADAMLVSSFDLSKAYEYHLSTGADITCICAADDRFLQPRVRFTLDDTGRAVDVKKGAKDGEGYVGVGVYILSRELLLKLVDECVAHAQYSFTDGVLLARHDTLKIMGYVVHDFVARPDTTRLYYDTSMELFRREVRRDLFPADRPVLTKVLDEAPTYYSSDVEVSNCLVSDGCYIEGDLENCIIFRGVKIGKGAKLRGCILMQNAIVGEGAELTCVIADKDTEIAAGRKLTGHESYPIIIAKGSKV